MSAGAVQAAAGEVTEEAQDDVAILRPALGKGLFVVVEIGQPPVAGGQVRAELVEAGGGRHPHEVVGVAGGAAPA